MTGLYNKVSTAAGGRLPTGLLEEWASLLWLRKPLQSVRLSPGAAWAVALGIVDDEKVIRWTALVPLELQPRHAIGSGG